MTDFSFHYMQMLFGILVNILYYTFWKIALINKQKTEKFWALKKIMFKQFFVSLIRECYVPLSLSDVTCVTYCSSV